MEWQIVLAILLVIPIIVLPLVFIMYLNVGGVYVAVRERRFMTLRALVRKIRIPLLVAAAGTGYGFHIWFFLSHFGWQVALAAGLALPVVLFVPVIVWAVTVSGLSLVIRQRLQRRDIVSRRKAARMHARVPADGV